ncbi:MAG: lipopolysaccharide heptosyltransferase II [Bryobacteraceae bacterium]
MEYSRILVRATNWVGDAVMSLPALRALRERFPKAYIAILALPTVADLYAREPFCDRLIPYNAARGARDWTAKWRIARTLAPERFDCAILLQNAFEAALVARLAGIPERIGYARDGRGWLLTRAIAVPGRGSIPRHERFYYLELLRRAGVLDKRPANGAIRLEGAGAARAVGIVRLAEAGLGENVIGISPGAAYGEAKRWLAERFAEAAVMVAQGLGARVALFGSKDERELCGEVQRMVEKRGIVARNLAGETALGEFIEMAAACRVFLTNDSGGMHIASALGVPTVAVFGATDEEATGPTGPLARVVREPVECSPCLLRECPIDHRCMTRVEARRVADAALELLK